MPNPDGIALAGAKVDLSSRFFSTQAVAASPSGSSETIIATLTISLNLVVGLGVWLEGWCGYTVGTSGVSGNLRIRQTNVSGAIVAASGALTVAATNLVAPSVNGLDTAPVLPGQVYVLTLTVGSGAAASTVSAVQLAAFVI